MVTRPHDHKLREFVISLTLYSDILLTIYIDNFISSSNLSHVTTTFFVYDDKMVNNQRKCIC